MVKAFGSNFIKQILFYRHAAKYPIWILVEWVMYQQIFEQEY